MRRFSDDEIISFISALDRALPGPFEVEIIGSAAAILLYHIRTVTEDIDTITFVDDIEGVIAEVGEAIGLPVPMGVAGVWDGPYSYRSRRLPVELPGLKNLRIYVPERHDWALMKIIRLKQKDREHILKVRDAVGFDPDAFLERFLGDMTHVIGRKEDLVYNFLAMMEDLFGHEVMVRMGRAIKEHEHWQ